MQDSALIRSIAFALLQAVFLAGAMLILINVLLVQSQTPVAAKE